jgi:hypothetical protein
MSKNLSATGSCKPGRVSASMQLAAAWVLVILVSAAASAYTLVLRDGRRIEVPSTFVLSPSTLTYEMAPGIIRTVQLILIDTAATERANNENTGGFYKHQQVETVTPAASSAHATKSLTNFELQSIQAKRVESEQKYEQRRLELGLPSVEETRRRQEEDGTAVRERFRDQSAARARDESYWHERARALRTEITSIDAEINYLREQLSQVYQFPLATHSLITSAAPLVPLANRSAFGPVLANPRTFTAPQVRGVQAMPRGQVINPAPIGGLRLARPIQGVGFPVNGFGLVGSATGFGFPVGPFGYVEDSYAGAELSQRLQSLMTTRAGLSAQWRELEDEARDAKVPQVWLEP